MVKDFIYFDTDYLQSYVSQVNKGLLFSRQVEQGSLRNEKLTQTGEQVVLRTTGAGTLGVVSGEHAREKTHEFGQTEKHVGETGHKMFSYEAHDDLFDDFYSHANEKKLFSKKPTVGKYIEVTDDYDFINLDFYRKIFNDSFIVQSMGEENSQQDGLSEVKSIIDAMEILLPCESFVITHGLLAPIKERFLRESYKEVKFKYSGKISVVGKVTSRFVKISHGDTNSKEFQDLIQATRGMDSAMFDVYSFAFSNRIQYIITPIALYF